MNLRIVLSLLLLCSGSLLSAQTFYKYEWENELGPAPEVPEEFKGAEALIIDEETYSFNKFTGQFPRLEQLATLRTQSRVLILGEEAAEDYSSIAIPKFRGRVGDFVRVKNIGFRIRKPDGKIIDLDFRNMKEVEIDEEDSRFQRKDDFYFYEIKGVEVGDQIERAQVIESKFPDRGRTVNFYGEYPKLRSRFTISIPKTVKLEGRSYANMPQPEVKQTSSQTVYSWEMENLKAIPEANSQGTIAENSLPYFLYSLNFDNFRLDPLTFSISSWKDILRQYDNDFLTNRARNRRKINDFYTNLFGGTGENLTHQQKAFYLNRYITTQMRLTSTREFEESELSNGVEYFLLEKKADQNILLSIYKDFFERFGIEHYLAFGKSRFSGALDFDFVSYSQVSEVFWVMKDNGGVGFIPITATGGLAELPVGLHGTDVYMYDLSQRSGELQKLPFPLDDMQGDGLKSLHQRSERMQLQINLADNTAQLKGSISLQGGFSSTERGGYVISALGDSLEVTMQRAWENRIDDKNVEVKTTTAKIPMDTSNFDHAFYFPFPEKPYPFRLDAEMSFSNLLKDKKDTLRLALDPFINHRIRNVVNAEDRELDYHIPFAGGDLVNCILVFDQPVTISNLEALAKDVETEHGSYSFSLQQLNDKTYRLSSRYVTNKLFIPAAEAKILQEANDAAKELLESELLILPKE